MSESPICFQSSLPRGPHHFIRLHHRVGAITVDAAFALSAPWTVLFGPSGSGKTTLLRAIAGLIQPRQASIVRNGARAVRNEAGDEDKPNYELLQLTDTSTKTYVQPHLRRIGYAPQRACLFPHLTVQQNVAFGAGNSSIAELIDLFHLASLVSHRPANLSGGERQRVNLARAFAASNSRLLLLDEPFAGLDHSLRDTLLPRMSAWLAARQIPVLSVTHDVVEALQLQSDVVTIREGKVTAQGPAAQTLAAERTRLLAHLT